VSIPRLPGGSVIVLDNARFHNPLRLENSLKIQTTGCFFQSYSPVLNPMEHFWDRLKNKARNVANQYKTLGLATMAAVNVK
jgi:transposase